MIRVTQSMGDYGVDRNLQIMTRQLMEAQKRASTGLGIGHAADDPAHLAMVKMLESNYHFAKQCDDNCTRAMMSLDVAEDALSGAADVLNRGRELALQMANDTLSAEDRAAAVEEVDRLFQQLVSLSNTKDGESYVFAGYRVDTPAFDDLGAFQGDSNVRRIEADEGMLMSIGVTGDAVFSPTGGQDAFAALSDLRAALLADDAQLISNAAGSLETAANQTIDARSTIGRQMDAVLRQQDVLAERMVGIDQQRSMLIEADSVEAFSDVVGAQNALNAAIRVSGRMMQSLSLVNQL
jgi:flagellar hook-associated protein 3 FlgL